MNKINGYFGGMFLSMALCLMSSMLHAQEPGVIKLEETIRGNQEQPKVLTIVPWQSPKTKQALPSPIVDRINKTFVPLQRDELKRQIQILNNKIVIPQPLG
ncbi:MAG: hypothetical protein ACI9LX_004175 [Paraglaciecola sp.]|jgi:hypothetical protein